MTNRHMVMQNGHACDLHVWLFDLLWNMNIDGDALYDVSKGYGLTMYEICINPRKILEARSS